jgi:hypothetical protein
MINEMTNKDGSNDLLCDVVRWIPAIDALWSEHILDMLNLRVLRVCGCSPWPLLSYRIMF